jgi:ribose 5-phosphate isomerase B
MMKIAIGSDHTAVELKAALVEHLKGRYEVVDAGTDSRERMDYQEVAWKVTGLHASGECERCILLCGTGVGMSLAANSAQGIRAVVCSEPYTARMSRLHNDTNVLCMGARVVGHELAKMIADIWLEAPFEGGRHKVRIDAVMEHRRNG